MIVDFSKINQKEPPVLKLKNAGGRILGVLGLAEKVELDLKFNETSVIEFELPYSVDGKPTPFYDSVVGLRTIELDEIGQFVLIAPKETGDGVDRRKACKAYSLEYEFTKKDIDMPEGTYNFWNTLSPDYTILGLIMAKMPSWSVGFVSSSLIDKYRTFSSTSANLYDFIKQTIQKSFRCIFDFDTLSRKVFVYDVNDLVPTEPIYISPENLAEEFEITENTESVKTRLDVSGATGVSIRDVNPCGTNQIINLDYYMTADNFDQALIDKYQNWKRAFTNSQQQYYRLSIDYSLEIMRRVTEQAALTDLQGELTSLENVQAVTIQSIAQGLQRQSDLDQANANIAAKKKEIEAKEALIEGINKDIESLMSQLKAITDVCRFESYFTESEYAQLDQYLIDESVSENTFVVSETENYSGANSSSSLSRQTLSITHADLTQFNDASGSTIYDVRGGDFVIGNIIGSSIISLSIRRKTDGSFTATAYLSKGNYDGKTFEKACLSITGSLGTVTTNAQAEQGMPDVLYGTSLNASITNAYMYYTHSTSEYERRSVAWDLFEYGMEILDTLSHPTYTFSVDSANFLCLDDFVEFKKKITLGHKAYIDMDGKGVITPIVIGAKLSYEDWDELELEFSNTFSTRETAFQLVDLLEKSISTGKSVSANKFAYSAFVDSGANTSIAAFMKSALDVSKNAILSSKNQAVSWDDAGIRLRKWKNDGHSAYENEQIWMNNNSILLTRDNWATASMAIGKFSDPNLGECWGIVAPNIVGTLLAGNSLVIESLKKDGGIAVFRVDGNGCTIHNSDLSVIGNGTHIALNPQIGIAIGADPVYTETNGSYKVNEDNAKFWVDTAGNLHFKGTLNAADGVFSGELNAATGTFKGKLSAATGSFTGAVTATSLVIQDEAESTLDEYISANSTVTGAASNASTALGTANTANGTANNALGVANGASGMANSALGAANNVHNGTSGIQFTDGTALAKCEINKANGVKLTGSGGDYFQVTNSAMGFYNIYGQPMLKFEKGNLTVCGTLSGCTGEFTGTVYATALYIGTGKTDLPSFISQNDTVQDAANTANAAAGTAGNALSTANGAASTAAAIVNGTTPAGVALSVETQNTRVTISDNGVVIKTGGVFTVESGNFSIDSNGLLRADDAYINGTLMSNGRPVLTRADIYVGSSAPANPTLGMVWIQPIQSSTQTATSTEHTYMWGAVDRLGLSSNHRTGVLSGSGVAAAGSNYTYDITVAVYASTNVSNVTVYLTLSSGGKSHTFTGTVSGIGHLLVDLSGTCPVWLAGTNSISFELSASSNNLLNDRNNHYISVKSYSNS